MLLLLLLLLLFSLEGVCWKGSVCRVLFQWLLGVVELIKIVGFIIIIIMNFAT